MNSDQDGSALHVSVLPFAFWLRLPAVAHIPSSAVRARGQAWAGALRTIAFRVRMRGDKG
jgi:hypothetical protein